MKRTKTFARSFSVLVLIAAIAALFMLAGITGCQQCPAGSHCQPDIPGGGTTPIAIMGTVLELWPTSSSMTHGDSVYYYNGSNVHLDTTKANGAYGATTPAVTFWDNVNPMYHIAFKSGINGFDAIIYNKLGAPPFIDLTTDSFQVTAAGVAIPLTVYAQKSDRSGCVGAIIQIKDTGLHNVGGPDTVKNANGMITYDTQLTQGGTYWIYVTGACGGTRFQFNTSAPLDNMAVNMCNLRLYVRL